MATTKRSRSTKNATRSRAVVAQRPRPARTLDTHPRSLALAVGAALLPWSTAQALPTGEQIVAGDVTVSRPTSHSMQINQATQKGIVNWNSFSIAAAEHVNITQLSSSSVLLNRVVGNNPSEIFGRLTANGRYSSSTRTASSSRRAPASTSARCSPRPCRSATRTSSPAATSSPVKGTPAP
jgi:hypothetical protein